MSEKFYPGGTTYGDSSPGFDAVRKKYGQPMVTRLQSWPEQARLYAIATYGPPDSGDDYVTERIQEEIATARKRTDRAKRDAEFALAQAEAIARMIPFDDWAAVTSVSQLHRSWGFDEEATRKERAAERGRPLRELPAELEPIGPVLDEVLEQQRRKQEGSP